MREEKNSSLHASLVTRQRLVVVALPAVVIPRLVIRRGVARVVAVVPCCRHVHDGRRGVVALANHDRGARVIVRRAVVVPVPAAVADVGIAVVAVPAAAEAEREAEAAAVAVVMTVAVAAAVPAVAVAPVVAT